MKFSGKINQILPESPPLPGQLPAYIYLLSPNPGGVGVKTHCYDAPTYLIKFDCWVSLVQFNDQESADEYLEELRQGDDVSHYADEIIDLTVRRGDI